MMRFEENFAQELYTLHTLTMKSRLSTRRKTYKKPHDEELDAARLHILIVFVLASATTTLSLPYLYAINIKLCCGTHGGDRERARHDRVNIEASPPKRWI